MATLNVGLPFNPTNPRVSVVFARPTHFAIALIVFLIVTDQIVQGETIVSRDEVNRSVWSPTGGLITVRTAAQAVSDLVNQPRVSLPETAYRVPIPPVPLRPTYRKVTNLVTPHSQIHVLIARF